MPTDRPRYYCPRYPTSHYDDSPDGYGPCAWCGTDGAHIAPPVECPSCGARVTDRDVDHALRSHHAIIVCPSCHGLGVHEGRGVVDDVTCGACGGGGEIANGITMPPGASARLGAMLAEGLRWTPTRLRWDGAPW